MYSTIVFDEVLTETNIRLDYQTDKNRTNVFSKITYYTKNSTQMHLVASIVYVNKQIKIG